MAFGLSNPGEDILAGAAWEPIRNVHLFAGLHWGRINTLRQRTFDDPGDTAAPTVDRRWMKSPKLALGLAFNVNVIAKIFNLKL